MKIDIFPKNEDVEIIGEVNEIKSGKLQIKEKNLPYFISMLTKIYSNRVGSIVREITSNCFDAHVKAGVTNEPVIIRKYIDDSGQRYIEFVDQGCGISEEAMEEIYASIGESDKRDSNEYFGAFGLGSKSPLSYSSHFYIITKVNGIEYTYLLNESIGEITYDCFVKTECDPSKNGTIIRIPIKKEDEYEFEKEIKSQLRYFTDVYVMGFNVANKYTIKKFDTFQVRTDMFDENPQSPLHVCYGKVYYPINWEVLGHKPINFNAALKFEIGELDVIFNREELEYTTKTKNAILNKLNEFKVELRQLIFNDEFYNKRNTYEYYKATLFLNEELRLVINFLDKEYQFQAGSFPFLDKVQYRIDLDGQLFTISAGGIRNIIKGSTKSIYKRTNGGVMNSHNAWKYFSNSNHKQLLFQKYNNYKYNLAYVIDNEPVLKNQKKFIADNYFDAIFTVSKRTMKKLIYRELVSKTREKNNVAELSSVSKPELLEKFYQRIFNDFIKEKFKSVEELNVPEDYGKPVKSAVTKEKDSILIYLRGKRLELKSVDELNENKNYIFTTTDNIKELRKLYSVFENFVLNLEFFYCSKKYISAFKNVSNCFLLEDILKEKEKSSFFKEEKISTLVEVFLHNKCVQGLNLILEKENVDTEFKYRMDVERFIKLAEDKYPKVMKIAKIIEAISKNKCSSELKYKVPRELKLNDYLSSDFIDKKVKSFISKSSKLIDNAKNIKNFTSDFEIELAYMDEYKYRNDINVAALEKNLEIKDSLINVYQNKF